MTQNMTALTPAQIKTLTVLARPGVYASHSTMTNAQFYDENNQHRPVCFTISKIAARQGTLEALRIRGLVETTKSGKTRMTESTRYTITDAGRDAIAPVAEATPPAAATAPKAITYRNIAGHIQPHSIDRAKCQHARVSGRFLMDSGSMATPMGYCVECGACVEWPAPVVKATPDSATSPALATQEHSIAISPMALPSKVVTAGNRQYRITHITDKSIAVERLDAGGYGGWQHEANYANTLQLSRFLARQTVAPVVTAQPAVSTSPCALMLQWQSIPLLPAPTVKPARPADVRLDYKCHSLAAVYGVDRDDWTCYADGPIVRKGVYTRFHSAESALASAKQTIDRKAAAGIKKGYRGL